MTRFTPIVLALLFVLTVQPLPAQTQPDRAILVIIDGLHIDAPERLEMPNFTRLADQGTLIEKVTGIMGYHPTTGEYAEVHTSSYPNPVQMAGTIFLDPGQSMLQHQVESSAFVANTTAYQSITEGYDYVIQKGETDEFAIDRAVDILRNDDVDFMRIHLQNAGSAGSASYSASESEPYYHDIWHEEAPYVAAIEEADRQLGRLVSSLKEIGKWEETLLVVTSDHGQTKTGWHPIIPEEAWMMPTVFHGPGIKQNETIEWADQIDIVPTIARLLNVTPPNEGGGSGKVLHGALTATGGSAVSSSKLLELNRIIKRYVLAEAELLTRSEEHPYLNSLIMRLERDFYGLDRILEWQQTGSIDSLIEHNRGIVEQMEQALAEVEDS